jgi:hypothetical protein
LIAKEKICGIIGFILSLPIAFLTFSTGALCCFNSTFWSIGSGTLFIVMPILIVLFSVTGLAGSFLANRYPFCSGIMMLVAVAGLLLISPFILFLSAMFFLLGGLLALSKFVKKQGKFKLKHAVTIIGSIAIIVLLFLGIFYFVSPSAYEGKFLYKVSGWSGDIWGGHIDYEDNYVAWIQREGGWKEGSEYLCILNISDEDNPSLVTKEKIEAYGPLGPLILSEGVLWKDKGFWYLYNTSNNQKNIVDIESGIGVQGRLLQSGSDAIYIYDLFNGSKQNINASPLCTSIFEDYVIWGERGNYSQWGAVPYEIWFYNISSGEKDKIITNLTLNHVLGASIAIYGDTIVYSDKLSIFVYDISTAETHKISNHSRKDVRNPQSQYFSNIRIFGENVIYVEISDELVGIDDFHQFFSYWVVNISSGKKVELKTAYCIDKEKVVGITVPGAENGLYLIDLKKLF